MKMKLFCLFISVFLFSGCDKTNQKKQDFISKKKDQVNQKNINKYDDLIVPEFLKQQNVLERSV